MRRWFLLVLTAGCCSAGEFNYGIREGGFAIHNGRACFNRPLFGTHEPTMLMSGDRPAFAYFAPTSDGKIGTLYLGVVTPRGAKWLHEFHSTDFVYQPGLTRHRLEDLNLGIEVTAVPLASSEGFAVRLRWVTRPAEPARLVWVFGGASGYRAPKSARVDKLHLSPEDAVGNDLRVWGDRFTLTAPAMKGRTVTGHCDLAGRLEARDAGTAVKGPAEAESAQPSKNAVAVFSGVWPPEREQVGLVFSIGATPSLSAFDEAVQHYRRLARRVRVETPDPHFDLAVEAMVVACDGIWQPPAFVHGALSWMDPYLGWRILYGPEAFGWHDRVRTNILAHAAQQLRSGDNRGAIPHILTDPRSVSYNMNEVFLDQIYHHYSWTGDRALLASLLPTIEGMLAWEKRHLDPDGNALYENCLNTWTSDSHWYNGGDSTQASAYMYRAHLLAAEALEAAGRDPEPYRREAARIKAAVNEKLWLPERGHYAEFIDRLGLKRVHPEPELPSIYHPIEFALADQSQALRMLRFTETNLRNETTAGGGRLVWSSNWAPNYNRTYTHSTYDLVFAEGLNLAIAYYKAEQFDEAYRLIKGAYAPMYLGAIPGGISCQAWRNGGQRRNEEFADGISLFARAAVEGVFGIVPELQHGIIHITPGFPGEWRAASIQTPDIEYTYRRSDSEIAIEAATAHPVRLHVRVPQWNAETTTAESRRHAVRLKLGPRAAASAIPPSAEPPREKLARLNHRGNWSPLKLVFTHTFASVLAEPFWNSEYRHAVCYDYMLDHVLPGRNQVPNDARLRRLTGAGGIFRTVTGIPFAQQREGNNIVALSRLTGLPHRLQIPVGRSARGVVLLISALTFPMQSHIANARVRVRYEGGGEKILDLVNPDNLDNGWGLFGGTYHYTANGMEVIGETAPWKPQAAPMTILSQYAPGEELPHEAWESLWYKQPPQDPPIPPHADLVEIACDPSQRIRSIEIEVLSNDVILALLGATLAE